MSLHFSRTWLRLTLLSSGTVLLFGCLPALVGPAPVTSPDTVQEGLQQIDQAQIVEVRTHLEAVTRSQQAYFVETGQFADSIADLAVAVPETVDTYQLAIAEADEQKAIMTAKSSSPEAPDLSAGVFFVPEASTTVAVLCEGTGNPQLQGTTAVCSD